MHFNRIYKSGHGLLRLFMLHVQLVYNICQLIMTWLSLGTSAISSGNNHDSNIYQLTD